MLLAGQAAQDKMHLPAVGLRGLDARLH